MSVPIALLIILLLIAGNAFFVALEFALVASDRQKLETEASEGSWSSKSAIVALQKLSFHLSGAQLGITITSLVLGFLSESIVRDLLEPVISRVGFLQSDGASIIFALVVATVFQMVLGELIPKNLAIAAPERVSKILSPAAAIVNGALTPIIVLFNGAANAIVRMMGLEPTEELSELVDLEDIGYIASESAADGLDAQTRMLLGRTVRFGDKIADDAMTPRPDVKYAKPEISVLEFLVSAREFGFSRYPVVAEDLDDVVGQVKVLDAFSVPLDDRSATTVADIMSEPLVVPESKELIDLLVDFDSADTELAIVIDEHGGTAGILTLEDVLEEIIGEVDDEYDEAEHLTRPIAEGIYEINGNLAPDEVAEAVGLVIPEGPYETVAGFMLSELQAMAEVGSQVTHDGWRLTVSEMDGRRIAAIRVNDERGGDA